MSESKRKKIAAQKSLLKSSKERKQHISKTIEWLRRNCSICPDVCLPREILFDQYMDFCKKQNARPACKATFGKLVRNTFPEVTSKRLGARGQSKYHYSGIGLKSSSDLKIVRSNEGVTRFSHTSIIREENSSKVFTLNSKVGTLLPMFPDVNSLYVPKHLDKKKLKVFLSMYRIHCQCIVDVIIEENFQEIRLFLLHFWQGFPDHLLSIFEHKITTDVLMICDSILHRTLIDILIPTEIIEVPEKLLQNVQNMALHWQKWLKCSLENMTSFIKIIKLEPAQRFCSALKRHVAVLHLSQVAKPVLKQLSLQSLYKELLSLEGEVYKKIPFIKVLSRCDDYNSRSLNQVECDVMNLLGNCNDIEQLVDSLDTVVSNIYQENEDIDKTEEQCLLVWVYILGRISLSLSENQSDHFTTFHFLATFIQEYLMLAMETRRMIVNENLVYSNLSKYLKTKAKYTSDSYKSPTSCFMVDARKYFVITEAKHSNSTENIINEHPHYNNTLFWT